MPPIQGVSACLAPSPTTPKTRPLTARKITTNLEEVAIEPVSRDKKIGTYLPPEAPESFLQRRGIQTNQTRRHRSSGIYQCLGDTRRFCRLTSARPKFTMQSGLHSRLEVSSTPRTICRDAIDSYPHLSITRYPGRTKEVGGPEYILP